MSGVVLPEASRARLCARWLEALLADYDERAAGFYAGRRDPFTNPVGHTFARALRTLVDGVLAGEPPGAEALDAVLRIRAIQGFAASRAVAFVPALGPLLRDSLVEAGAPAEQLAAAERAVAELLPAAFDAYVSCREGVNDARLAAMQRSVATLVRRWRSFYGADPSDPEPAEVRVLSGRDLP